MLNYTQQDFLDDCAVLSNKIEQDGHNFKFVLGIPQGGATVAMQLAKNLDIAYGVTTQDYGPAWFSEFKDNILIVDDLSDSGETIDEWASQGYSCAVLGHKVHSKWPKMPENQPTHTFAPFYSARIFPNDWIHFWWEPVTVDGKPSDPTKHVTRLLEYIGEDPNRDGLKGTPERVIRSYSQLFGGYGKDPSEIFTSFDEPTDEMVLMRNISFSSTCEHHMLPFTGIAHIAYIPRKREQVIGASKMIRLLEIFAHRLQIQERIGHQVVQSLEDYIKPHGAACIIEAVHECIRCRGVRNQTSEFVTSAMTGVFRDDKNKARVELLHLMRK